MKINRSLKLLLTTLLVSCSVEGPELIPCMCDGEEKTLGLFDCMCEPGKKKPVKKIAYIQDEPETTQVAKGEAAAYAYLHHNRSSYAPVKLEYVDFRIPRGQKFDEYETKLGNYRFRIFGCRRFDKEVYLNQGRAMQKDMRFFDVFFEQMNDYYPVVVDKSNPYYIYSDKAQPEYILTAEITDYFMNVCDEFDWNETDKKNLRTGTSEMTVTWRLMNLAKDKVYCKGTTTGYGEMKHGEYKGETLLVERAFGDALTKLPQIDCYNEQVSQRITPEQIEAQLEQIAYMEGRKDNFRNQYKREIDGIELLQSCGSGFIDETGAATGTGSSTMTTTTVNSVSYDGDTTGRGQIIDIKTTGTEYKVGGYMDENGNIVSSSSVIDEYGNVMGSGSRVRGYIDEKGNFIAVTSKGMTIAKGQEVTGFIDENGNFIATGSVINESGGVLGSGQKIKGYIDEKGNFVAIGSVINETGGSLGNGQEVKGYIDENGNFVATGSSVSENSGVSGSGQIAQGYINEQGNFVSTGSVINETGGTLGKGQNVEGYIDQKGNFVASAALINETGGVSGSGSTTVETKTAIIRQKGLNGLQLSTDCQEVRLDENACSTIKVVKNNITWADDYWLDVPLNQTSSLKTMESRTAVEQMFSDSKNSFCILSVPPYENMSPENLYKLRASVVSVENPYGRKGAGLIISDQLILTSADLLDKRSNNFTIRTINGVTFGGSAFRVNPNKNVALINLDEKTKFSPLPLNLALPPVGKDMFMALGLLDLNDGGENLLDTQGQVIGYRYTEEKGAEIIVNTDIQSQTLGSTLIDKSGNVTGLSHTGVRAKEGGDLFLPIETALKSLGVDICGVKYVYKKRPAAVTATVEKRISTAIDSHSGGQAPEVLKAKERK